MPFFVVLVATELVETDLINFVDRSLAPGAGCLKLTTSFVKVLLKFKKLILQICCDFLLKNVRIFCKRFSHFSNKKL